MLYKDVAAFFDKVALTYDQSIPFFSRFSHHLLTNMALADGMSVLDIGTGNASFLPLPLLFPKISLTGIDVSHRMLQVAQLRPFAPLLSARFVQSDAHALPFQDNIFDAVYACSVWPFFSDQRRVASEVRRVCKVGAEFSLCLLSSSHHNWGFFNTTLNTYVALTPSIPPPPLSEEARVIDCLRSAGWDNFVTSKEDFTFHFESVDQWWQWQCAHYGRRHFDKLSDQMFQRFKNDIYAKASVVFQDEGLWLKQNLILVRSKKALH
ncbi:class I SAM-dependent methyltransferase [Pseudomonas graminis]|uniref:class I SAM-dependent methyltransferase n=1 Tax=Pseudomonas graminis TaxID=158627 RepID=UPI00234B3815|nr:class I SAM-dependent methyltransferase [Pseudomonas graminis]MDC6379892.1 class I SAM-dependent methyltransferase [Pseudomonas graminis]